MAIGRSRNVGAMYARSPFILFQDVDLMPCPGFYSAILREIDVRQLRRKNDDFLMCGYIFLTEAGTREFLRTEQDKRLSYFLHHLFENDTTLIEKFSNGTPACVYSRYYYLARGGNDPAFANWGYEDLEFNTRLIRRMKKFPLPQPWPLDYYRSFNTIVEYCGWKAPYRLMGDLCFPKGLVLFHAWHEVNKSNTYMRDAEKNHQLFTQRMREYVEDQREPDPLPCRHAGRSVIFRKNAFTWQREMAPMLGEVVFEDEDRFASPEELQAYLAQERIDRIVFHNPYRNDQTVMLYQTCRENNIPYLVCERGALRNSIFFDPNGFNADSASYHPDKWDHLIDENQRAAVMAYIGQERSVDHSLEAQSDRVGDIRLLQDLGLTSDKKILFVPYQRPGDTVITHLCGPIETFDNFLKLVRETAAQLPPEWVVVTKRHPLEDELPEMPGVLQANNANIKDLLDVADALLLINSGVGLLGMIWEKPVLYAGDAFYAHPGMNVQVKTPEEVIQALESGFKPDREKILRLLSYLLHEFYSFGEFVTRPAIMPDGSRITATMDIRYRVIRMPGYPEINLYTGEEPQIGFDSILFDRYRHAEEIAAGIKPPPPYPGPPSLKRSFKDFIVAIATYPYGIRRRLKKIAKLLTLRP